MLQQQHVFKKAFQIRNKSWNENYVKLAAITQVLLQIEIKIIIVRVAFDDNLFYPAGGLFRKVLPTYYTVVV